MRDVARSGSAGSAGIMTQLPGAEDVDAHQGCARLTPDDRIDPRHRAGAASASATKGIARPFGSGRSRCRACDR
jgi:hypothetical protein